MKLVLCIVRCVCVASIGRCPSFVAPPSPMPQLMYFNTMAAAQINISGGYQNMGRALVTTVVSAAGNRNCDSK